MALINCPECGKQISDTLSECIHCGFVLQSTNSTSTPPSHTKKDTKDIPIKEVLQDFLQNNKAYKIYKIIDLIGGILDALICVLGIIVLIGYFLIALSIGALDYAISPAPFIFGLGTIFILGSHVCIDALRNIIETFTVFFGLKKENFNIEKTLAELSNNKGLMSVLIDREAWLQIFNMYSKFTLIMEFIAAFWLWLIAGPTTVITMSLGFMLLPKMLSNSFAPMIAVVLGVLATCLLALIVWLIIMIPAFILKLIIKNSQNQIINRWKSGEIKIDSPDSKATEEATDTKECE